MIIQFSKPLLLNLKFYYGLIQDIFVSFFSSENNANKALSNHR